ncbi:hypothetical protein A3Q56_01548 [Intoshia linei]|uniref:Exocyst complex component Sec10-like alpha-helical bundle domain-containing protein n=1 Tax=Intoshia linei TaxID=1819745 RepID=A0A177B8T0_9BILA|nr:hypothetical protein A3Q56_01548 [Intoshia linei]
MNFSGDGNQKIKEALMALFQPNFNVVTFINKITKDFVNSSNLRLVLTNNSSDYSNSIMFSVMYGKLNSVHRKISKIKRAKTTIEPIDEKYKTMFMQIESTLKELEEDASNLHKFISYIKQRLIENHEKIFNQKSGLRRMKELKSTMHLFKMYTVENQIFIDPIISPKNIVKNNKEIITLNHISNFIPKLESNCVIKKRLNKKSEELIFILTEKFKFASHKGNINEMKMLDSIIYKTDSNAIGYIDVYISNLCVYVESVVDKFEALRIILHKDIDQISKSNILKRVHRTPFVRNSLGKTSSFCEELSYLIKKSYEIENSIIGKMTWPYVHASNLETFRKYRSRYINFEIKEQQKLMTKLVEKLPYHKTKTNVENNSALDIDKIQIDTKKKSTNRQMMRGLGSLKKKAKKLNYQFFDSTPVKLNKIHKSQSLISFGKSFSKELNISNSSSDVESNKDSTDANTDLDNGNGFSLFYEIFSSLINNIFRCINNFSENNIIISKVLTHVYEESELFKRLLADNIKSFYLLITKSIKKALKICRKEKVYSKPFYTKQTTDTAINICDYIKRKKCIVDRIVDDKNYTIFWSSFESYMFYLLLNYFKKSLYNKKGGQVAHCDCSLFTSTLTRIRNNDKSTIDVLILSDLTNLLNLPKKSLNSTIENSTYKRIPRSIIQDFIDLRSD